jgi:hypothetical protein
MLFFAFMFYSVQASAQVSEFDVREKLDEHIHLLEAADKMYSNRSAVPLPMMADVYGPDQIDIPAGQQYKTEYLVENIGTVPLNEIELQVETIAKEKVQSIWIEPDQIASLSPGKAVKVHLYIESEYSGQDLVQLRIESNEISKTQILRITQ